MAFTRGNIVHIEIPAPDIAAAKEFYGKLFGWTFRPMNDTYEFFDAGNMTGAMDADLKPGTDAGSVLVMAVEEIDTALAAIEQAGGKVIKPKTPIGGDHGFYGYFTDPAGNKMGVWQERPASNG
ncbi:MAG: VOC family protein [Planctomycetota bacterium]